MADIDLDDLANELAEFAPPEKPTGRSPREERIIAGFEEVQRFVAEHGRAPQHGEDRDIFERLYAVRLDRLRALEECRDVLAPLDHQGLLGGLETAASDAIDDDALMAELAELGAETENLTHLRHVRSSAEKQAADEIANRERCADFDQFKPIFDSVQRELDAGIRETRLFKRDSDAADTEIAVGHLFILGGQKAWVVSQEDPFETDEGRINRRMRVIFDNGTEIKTLLRSFQRALYKDNAARRITEPTAGPLFTEASGDGDEASGTIYVLRSKSDLPQIAGNRDLIHKIGVTNLPIERRIAGARLQPTFLMADVELVTTYKLFNINRSRLENLIHRVFSPARLDIEINDRFGNPVAPREWFLVPLGVIDEAVQKIRDGTITQFFYNPESGRLDKR